MIVVFLHIIAIDFKNVLKDFLATDNLTYG